MAFLENAPKATRNIIIINILFFIAASMNRRSGGAVSMDLVFALSSPAGPLSAFFRPWQLLTYMFMHGGFLHLLLNMYTLFIFGSVVENIIGTKKFLSLYFLGGLGAAALHMLTSSSPMIGASGAVYGILIAYVMIFPDSRLSLIFPPVTLKAKKLALFFVAFELMTGVFVTSDGVAHFAHLGGMAVGALLVWLWRRNRKLFDKDEWI